MQQILTGIYNAYSASAALKAALPGGLHFELSPQGTAFTYAVYNLITGRPDYLLAGEYYEVVRVQFDIYAATNALRLTAYGALTTVYDDATPAATGYTPIIMERVNQQLVREGEQDEIFRAIVEYDCWFKKGA